MSLRVYNLDWPNRAVYAYSSVCGMWYVNGWVSLYKNKEKNFEATIWYIHRYKLTMFKKTENEFFADLVVIVLLNNRTVYHTQYTHFLCVKNSEYWLNDKLAASNFDFEFDATCYLIFVDLEFRLLRHSNFWEFYSIFSFFSLSKWCFIHTVMHYLSFFSAKNDSFANWQMQSHSEELDYRKTDGNYHECLSPYVWKFSISIKWLKIIRSFSGKFECKRVVVVVVITLNLINCNTVSYRAYASMCGVFTIHVYLFKLN